MIPSIRFADLPVAVAFYVHTLGFDVVRGTAEDGNVALARGDARVMLEAAGDFYSESYNRAIAERLGNASPHAFYIEERELDAYYERVQGGGAKIVDPLTERPWGQREFTVEDHDGNWLTFWAA